MQDELTETISARLPQSLKRNVESEARRQRRSLGAQIVWIVEQYYGQQHVGTQGQRDEHLTNRERQKARYDELIRAACEDVAPGLGEE